MKFKSLAWCLVTFLLGAATAAQAVPTPFSPAGTLVDQGIEKTARPAAYTSGGDHLSSSPDKARPGEKLVGTLIVEDQGLCLLWPSGRRACFVVEMGSKTVHKPKERSSKGVDTDVYFRFFK